MRALSLFFQYRQSLLQLVDLRRFLACIGNGKFEYPMLHTMFLVCECVPEGVFEGETFFHTKTNCVFANLKFVVETLIPKRYPEVIVVVGFHEKVPVAQEFIQEIGERIYFEVPVKMA